MNSTNFFKKRVIEILHEDILLARATYDLSKGVCTIEPILPEHFLYPLPSNCSVTQLYDFLCDRCVPQTRVNISEILQHMGLEEYSVWGILEFTHGISVDDSYWIRFNGEALRYEDIKTES